MWAAIDTETCLRRGWCQPIGGFSVYSTPSLTIAADDHKPIIVVSASLDSRSLFHDLTVGANQVISGVVTVLGIAEAMNKVKKKRRKVQLCSGITHHFLLYI